MVYNTGREPPCNFVQILTHAYGTAEVLASLVANEEIPISSAAITMTKPIQEVVSKVTNLAACAVPTYLVENSTKDDQQKEQQHNTWRRILSAFAEGLKTEGADA